MVCRKGLLGSLLAGDSDCTYEVVSSMKLVSVACSRHMVTDECRG